MRWACLGVHIIMLFAREADAIAEFQNMVVANSRENLLMILDKQTELLEKIIEDGLAETTKPKERLAIYKALGERLEKLSQTLQTSNQDDTFTADYLKGPMIRKGISRFTAGSIAEDN